MNQGPTPWVDAHPRTQQFTEHWRPHVTGDARATPRAEQWRPHVDTRATPRAPDPRAEQLTEHWRPHEQCTAPDRTDTAAGLVAVRSNVATTPWSTGPTPRAPDPRTEQFAEHWRPHRATPRAPDPRAEHFAEHWRPFVPGELDVTQRREQFEPRAPGQYEQAYQAQKPAQPGYAQQAYPALGPRCSSPPPLSRQCKALLGNNAVMKALA